MDTRFSGVSRSKGQQLWDLLGQGHAWPSGTTSHCPSMAEPSVLLLCTTTVTHPGPGHNPLPSLCQPQCSAGNDLSQTKPGNNRSPSALPVCSTPKISLQQLSSKLQNPQCSSCSLEPAWPHQEGQDILHPP